MPRKQKVPEKVYEFIQIWKQEHDGNSPTYAEISKYFGWKSETTAWWAVDKLEHQGRIRYAENRRVELIGGEYIPPESEIA